MKIYRQRWWHDEDKVRLAMCLGVMALALAVALWLGCRRPATGDRPPTQVLPAPTDEELPGLEGPIAPPPVIDPGPADDEVVRCLGVSGLAATRSGARNRAKGLTMIEPQPPAPNPQPCSPSPAVCPLCGSDLAGQPVTLVGAGGTVVDADGQVQEFTDHFLVCRRHGLAHWLLPTLPPRVVAMGAFDLLDQCVQARRMSAGLAQLKCRRPTVRHPLDGRRPWYERLLDIVWLAWDKRGILAKGTTRKAAQK